MPRPSGSGKPKGYKAPQTLEKANAREIVRQLITASLRPLVQAQLAAAIGTSHLMLRNEDGTWRKAGEDDDIERALNGDPNLRWIATKDSNTQAANLLLAYAVDKPQEPPQALDVTLTGSVELIERLTRARKRVTP